MKIFESKIVREIEKEQMAAKTPSLELMECAALAVFSEISARFTPVYGKRIAVFCGNGKNGGDGFAVARLLLRDGAEVRCYFVETGGTAVDVDTAEMRTRYSDLDGKLVEFVPQSAGAEDFCAIADIIVDAIFGIGFRGSLEGGALAAARLINSSAAQVVAVDLPSGALADSGLICADCVKADVTVTFVAAQPAHFIHPAKDFCGEVVVVEIGISRDILARHSDNIQFLDSEFLDEIIPERRADSHKGNYGKVLIVGGSKNFTGAILLVASAALRSGAGLVYVVVPECIYEVIAGKIPEMICVPAESDGFGFSAAAVETVLEFAEKCDVCVLGPGLGRSAESDALVMSLVLELKIPLVLDADGINALSGNINILRASKAPAVLTPHDVEFSRLGGDLSEGRHAAARRVSRELGAVIALKGNATIVCVPDGSAFINTSGNPGMATGGTGDALAGVIAALIGQGIELAPAAAAGVYIHGSAGDLAATEIGEYGMLPSDLIMKIPQVLKKFNSKKY